MIAVLVVLIAFANLIGVQPSYGPTIDIDIDIDIDDSSRQR